MVPTNCDLCHCRAKVVLVPRVCNIYAIVMPKLHLYTTVRQFSNVYGIFVLMAKFTKVLEGWQVC
jgi:hypothetical protein